MKPRRGTRLLRNFWTSILTFDRFALCFTFTTAVIHPHEAFMPSRNSRRMGVTWWLSRRRGELATNRSISTLGIFETRPLQEFVNRDHGDTPRPHLLWMSAAVPHAQQFDSYGSILTKSPAAPRPVPLPISPPNCADGAVTQKTERLLAVGSLRSIANCSPRWWRSDVGTDHANGR